MKISYWQEKGRFSEEESGVLLNYYLLSRSLHRQSGD